MKRTSRGLQVREQRGEVAGARDHGARGRAEVDAEFAGDDLGHRRFAEARRARQQDVVERFVAAARGVDEDLQVRARLILADEFGERERAERGLAGVVVARFGCDEAVGFGHASCPQNA